MANFEKYKDRIEATFVKNDYRVLTTEEFEGLISKITNIKGLKSASRRDTKDYLFQNYVTQSRLAGESSSEFYYFKKDEVDQYDIAATRSRSAFFSHYSALSIHNLTIQIPKQIYLTWERKGLRNQSNNTLKQSNVDVAFNKAPRITHDKRKYRNYTVNFINGQRHEYLGVQRFRKNLWVSDIERTLIDVSVRPFYAGGVTQVLQAYEAARGILDTTKLYDYYDNMDFTYPYHKAIGFYLEKAGYSKNDYGPFLDKFTDIDFYLTYKILHKKYNEKWKLFIPEGF